ncbi:AmpG family muropeptide MFS transporter [Simiduia curdlanivorans]|uniref:AmpG family muropeptide MFS transporter n=1 Tax=Simiduia curdlanivorans TaxID=1492769 RepID=A0ABV8V6W1_9GAMM|nr:AmpG family muropeptide MFS transporter [Simiduia curdlanivorans]MDN3639001.1 AmpG family muropeptide MFS transporter [Simiduia curdlanivorans]
MDWAFYRRSIFNRRMLVCVATGFASGMPLYVLIQLVPAWLRTEGVGLAEIGLFALIGFPYTWKFLWAPLLDRYSLPLLGRRRGWMLATQLSLLASIAALGFIDPKSSLMLVATLSALVAFFSATQDIVLDAFRREILPDAELGIGLSINVQAYRLSSLIPGSLALILADHLAWSWVFSIVAGFMLVAIAATFWFVEPKQLELRQRTFFSSVVAPFKEFIGRKGLLGAALLLLFMLLYKLGDNMATALSSPFYIDLGYSLSDIGLVAKNAALWPAIVGGLLGGLLMLRWGINRALWIFGVVQLTTILGFAWLALQEPNNTYLALVIAAEYLGVGLGTAAFTAFQARETSPLFAATQLALFTALASIPRTFVNASTGWLVEVLGWYPFFMLCALVAIPGMLLLFLVAPWGASAELRGTTNSA